MYYSDLLLSPFSGDLYNGDESNTIVETDYDNDGHVFPDCCPNDQPQDSCTGTSYPGLDPQNSKSEKFLNKLHLHLSNTILSACSYMI